MKRPGLKVFVAAHVSEVYGPVQALRDYLAREAEEAWILTHPFPYTGLPCSMLEGYAKGRLVHQQRLGRRIGLAPLQFVRNLLGGFRPR